MQTGVSKVLRAIGNKYKRCLECSIGFQPDQLVKKVIEGNYVEVLVRHIISTRKKKRI